MGWAVRNAISVRVLRGTPSMSTVVPSVCVQPLRIDGDVIVLPQADILLLEPWPDGRSTSKRVGDPISNNGL